MTACREMIETKIPIFHTQLAEDTDRNKVSQDYTNTRPKQHFVVYKLPFSKTYE
jgi:hypothetical protein